MIWYKAPVEISTTMFITILLTASMQIIIALESGELVREKSARRFFLTFYMVLAILSLISLTEVLLAIVSVEGGIYLEVWTLPRYIFILPALLYIFACSSSVKLPPLLKPVSATFFIPLFRLPLTDTLPMPLPVAISVIAILWMMADSVLMVFSIRTHARLSITRDVLRRIIRSMGRGICISNRRGQILEVNPAFRSLCGALGIPAVERVCELDEYLTDLQHGSRVNITDMENGRLIRIDEQVFFLRHDRFLLRKKTYTQLSLSDLTQIYRTTADLEKEKKRLDEKNRELQEAMDDIMLGSALLEREKLCRSAHDTWSQKMAVAGLSLDMLLQRVESSAAAEELAAISGLLDNSSTSESAKSADGLHDILHVISGMYCNLGVEVHISGQAEFNHLQQEVLGSVLKEALANAVRHAYARLVNVVFLEDEKTAAMLVQNSCLDDVPFAFEGRGLHDIRTRVKEAGGNFQYEKSGLFRLRVEFAKKRELQQEVF